MAQLTELRHNSQIMPKQIPQDELDAILEAVTQFPEGASVENLSGQIANNQNEISPQIDILVYDTNTFPRLAVN